MSAKECLGVSQIDNGYLIEYSTGETKKFDGLFGPQERIVTGTRFAPTAAEAGSIVTALLERMQRKESAAPVPPKEEIPDRI